MGLLSRMGRAATALSKYYYPFTWKNKPSIESPINEVHLNHIEDGINEMDNRILILAQDKADASDMANVFIDFDIDDTTGTMTFTRFDGTTKSRDTPMEKIILNCYLEDDNFVLVLADGTKQKVSLAKFIDTYTFINSDTIRFTVNNKNISADIPDGKITLAKLEPTIMSTIRQYALDAQTAQGVAEQAAGTAQGWAIGGTGFEDNNAKHYASRSQRYAVGGVEEGDTEDNAKYYCQQAQAAAEQATEVAGFDGTASTVSAIDTQGVAVRKASGTTHVTITAGGPEPDVGLEYFGQPGDKVTVQDMCDSLAAPGFDDSGVVQEISGFSDFLNRMTSGMRLPSFFRDLKAGLKFVLHTGQLVNNGLCNEPGKYPLDAAYGRTLLEMIGNTEILPGGAADIVSAIVAQNSNLGMKITSGNMTEIIGALPVGKYAGYYSSGSFGAPSHYGTFEAVVMNPSTATITAIDTSNKVSYLNVKTSDVWCGWQSSSYGIYLSDRDLNTVKLPGTYIQTANASATTTLHYPVAGAAGFLEVVGLNNNDWLLQRYTGWGTANQTYKRVLYQGSWRDWMAE